MKKTKILIFGLSSLIGGVETYIINLVKNIDKKKFEIDLLLQEELTGINKEKIEGFYNRIFIVENFKRHPIKATKTLNKIYKENNYDVIHMCLSTASSCMYAIPRKKYNKKTKIIVHSHNGSDKNKLQHYIFRKILNLITDEYVACSNLAAEWMFGNKIASSGKVMITNNAIETNKFLYNEQIREKIRKELEVQDDFVIGHVGRFNEQKNHEGLINLFYKLTQKEQNVKLLLLGSGDLEKEIKQKVEELNLQEKVLFLGAKANVNEYYQAMDLFVLPSLFEGLPIVGIEAQTSGLKCIFSDNITKETDITNNVSFISNEKKEEWVNKIIEYKNIGYERKDMKDKIKEAGYDLEEEIKKIEKIYKYKEE